MEKEGRIHGMEAKLETKDRKGGVGLSFNTIDPSRDSTSQSRVQRDLPLEHHPTLLKVPNDSHIPKLYNRRQYRHIGSESPYFTSFHQLMGYSSWVLLNIQLSILSGQQLYRNCHIHFATHQQ